MNFPLAYPVKITIKLLLSLASQISVRDANGAEVVYVRQKLEIFKRMEEINIFSDQSQTRRLYGIKTDRSNWSARYDFANDIGQDLGSVKRQGARSLWMASYDVLKDEQIEFHIREESALARLMGALFDEVPFLRHIFRPVYLVSRGSALGEQSAPVMRMTNKPSFAERNFYVEKVDSTLTAQEEERILLSLFMLTLLEGARG
jgi:hypothetical protein